MYTVKLSDGTKIRNLGLNGDNFVSSTKIEDSVFAGKLSHVEITDSESGEVQILEDAELILNKQYGDEYWFVIKEKPQSEKDKKEVNDSITDLQVGLAEVYELIVGGM